MGTFVYKAVNSQGRPSTEGRLEAADSRAATFSLEKMGLIPVSIAAPVSREPLNLARFGLSWVSRRDILFFTEELSTLVRAGLPLDRSLSVAAELTPNPTLKNVILDILKQIKGGQSLAEAMGGHPKYFSPLYINMIRAGEAGGILDAILARLTEFERSADELRSYLRAALVYPILLTLVGLGSLGILFSLVIPRFATIFEDVGAEIPPLTLAMLTVSTSVRSYWWIMILAVAANRSGGASLDAVPFGQPAMGRHQASNTARRPHTAQDRGFALLAHAGNAALQRGPSDHGSPNRSGHRRKPDCLGGHFEDRRRRQAGRGFLAPDAGSRSVSGLGDPSGERGRRNRKARHDVASVGRCV